MHGLDDIYRQLVTIKTQLIGLTNIGNALASAAVQQTDLLASIDRSLKSIDAKTPTPPDIRSDGAKIHVSQKGPTS